MSTSSTKDNTLQIDRDPSLRAGEIPTAATAEKLDFRMAIPDEVVTTYTVDFVPGPIESVPEVVNPVTRQAVAEMLAAEKSACQQEVIRASAAVVTIRHLSVDTVGREN